MATMASRWPFSCFGEIYLSNYLGWDRQLWSRTSITTRIYFPPQNTEETLVQKLGEMAHFLEMKPLNRRIDEWLKDTFNSDPGVYEVS